MSPITTDDMLAQAGADVADADERNIFHVDIDGFEGPLHLLLDLARRQRVDLARISILALANQYLAFIAAAQDRRMDLAADYLLMAAWLAYLKSRLLLPTETALEDAPDAETMAGRLAFRLKRLDAMRRAHADLYDGVLDQRDVFARGAPERSRIVRTSVWTASLYDLMKAFADINVRKHKVRAHVVKRQPVLALETARRRLAFLVPELEEWTSVQSMRAPSDVTSDVPPRSVTASFFSAALELTRDRAIELRQDKAFSEVYVRRLKAQDEAMKAAE